MKPFFRDPPLLALIQINDHVLDFNQVMFKPFVPQIGDSSTINLVVGIVAQDAQSVETLFSNYKRGLALFFKSQLRTDDVDDFVSETLIAAWTAVGSGAMRDPAKLNAFIRTIAKRLVFQKIRQRVRARLHEIPINHQQTNSELLRSKDVCPEAAILVAQQKKLIQIVLRSLPKRDRDILRRFYLQEQNAETIQRDMSLTTTQFRLVKNLAKARFGYIGASLVNGPKLRRSAARGTSQAGPSSLTHLVSNFVPLINGAEG